MNEALRAKSREKSGLKWSDYKIKKVKLGDKDYPLTLAAIKGPPKQLFYRGDLGNKRLFNKTLSIVGSRAMTRYGMQVVKRFIPALVEQKVTIISGFMYGIDTAAHTETAGAGGQTIAVLASGLNQFYPPENDKLYTKILQENGLILSEYEPEEKSKLWTFPQRNRIVAGLSTLGVLVVEAGHKSGSLITARFAKKYDKKIFAVPGPITSSTSVGTNALIKAKDALLVTSPEDILGIKHKTISKKLPQTLNTIEKKIFESLLQESSSVDELSAQLGISVVEVSNTTSMMQLKGLITEAAGKYYANQ